jgi:hypothetical protein
MPKASPRNKVGVIVHAILKNVLSNHTAKNIYGNENYSKTFIQSTGGGRMNNTTTNMITNTTTTTTTDKELEQERFNLAKHEVREVRGIHC